MNTVKGYCICWPIYYTKQANGHNLYLKKKTTENEWWKVSFQGCIKFW